MIPVTQLSLLGSLFLLLISLWPALLLLALYFLYRAFAKARGGGRRAAWIVVAVVLALPSLPGVPLYARQIESDQRVWQTDRDLRVSGYVVPAGSTLRLKGSAPLSAMAAPSLADIDHIRLSSPAYMLGGYIDLLGQEPDEWLVRLVKNQVVDGWPCMHGQISLSLEGALTYCVLTEAVTVFGYEIPALASISLQPEAWEFEAITFYDGSRGIEGLSFDPQTGRLLRVDTYSETFLAPDIPVEFQRLRAER